MCGWFGGNTRLGLTGLLDEALQSIDSARELRGVAGLTFPHGGYPPAEAAQLAGLSSVPLAVPFDFFAPPLGAGTGPLENRTTAVAVPEAAIHEDYEAVPGEHQIGATGQAFHV